MLLETSPPIDSAPATSKATLISSACRTVSAPAPTLVPIELAMSFAPLAAAIRNATGTPMKTAVSTSDGLIPSPTTIA